MHTVQSMTLLYLTKTFVVKMSYTCNLLLSFILLHEMLNITIYWHLKPLQRRWRWEWRKWMVTGWWSECSKKKWQEADPEEDHASAGMTTLSSNTLDFWLYYSTHQYCSRYCWTLLHMHVHQPTSCRGDIAIVGWLIYILLKPLQWAYITSYCDGNGHAMVIRITVGCVWRLHDPRLMVPSWFNLLQWRELPSPNTQASSPKLFPITV